MRTPNHAAQEENVLVSLESHLTTAQIEWLNDRADQKDVSVDHLVRRFVEAARAGDGASTEAVSPSATSDSDPVDEGTTLGQLREMKEMVESLKTSDEESEEADPLAGGVASSPEPSPTGEAAPDDASSGDASSSAVNSPRSMFDFV